MQWQNASLNHRESLYFGAHFQDNWLMVAWTHALGQNNKVQEMCDKGKCAYWQEMETEKGPGQGPNPQGSAPNNMYLWCRPHTAPDISRTCQMKPPAGAPSLPYVRFWRGPLRSFIPKPQQHSHFVKMKVKYGQKMKWWRELLKSEIKLDYKEKSDFHSRHDEVI